MDKETRRHLIHGIDFALIILRAVEVFLIGVVIALAGQVVVSIIEAVQAVQR